MNQAAIKNMLWELLHEIDYDIAKSYDPETAEDPIEAKIRFQYLVDIVRDHL